MSSKDKRKLAAIMFADIVGYSRMMASDEERTLELLKDFESICSPIISDNEGKIIKKVGDELFCEFSSAKEAVDCALSIQKSIQPFNDSRPKDFKLQVRIGIHIGDIVLRDGDVFGDGVNVASRIQPFSNPGGICVSNAVRDALSSHPKYKLQVEGEQELKNIIEKHTLYSIKTGFEEKNIVVNKSKNRFLNIFILLGLCIFAGLYFLFDLNNQKETSITKKELDAEKTRILIPYLGSRNELVKIINKDEIKSYFVRKHGEGTENPSDYSLIPFSEEEKNTLYNELITKINTTFFTDNIIYSASDVDEVYEKQAKITPDFSTFPTEVEVQLLADSIRKIVFEPFNYFVPDTLNKIMEMVDDNKYANQLILVINGYNIVPPLGYIEKTAFVDILFKRVHKIYKDDKDEITKTVSKSSLFEGVQSNNKRFISDILDLINRIIQRYSSDEFVGEIKSIDKDKVFIKIRKDQKLIKNMELSVMRQYQYQDSLSIQNRIKHIKDFLICCDNNSNDKDCINFHTIDMWDNTELDKLISKEHHLHSGVGLNQLGLNKIIYINEVYDSIAVGKVIQNPTTCIELLPGDLLKLNK